MSEKITLPSQAILEVHLLSLEEAWGVVQTISGVLEKINVNLEGLDLSDIRAIDLLNFKSPLCAVLASKEVVEAAKICMKKCTYNSLRIDGQTFDSKEARGDYLAVVFYSLKENIAPFFGKVTSILKMS
jgi:hypothetical protein